MEQPEDSYYDLEMEILNEIIEPKLVTNKGPSRTGNLFSREVSSEQRCASRLVNTITSRGLRTMRNNESTMPMRTTAIELPHKKRS